MAEAAEVTVGETELEELAVDSAGHGHAPQRCNGAEADQKHRDIGAARHIRDHRNGGVRRQCATDSRGGCGTQTQQAEGSGPKTSGGLTPVGDRMRSLVRRALGRGLNNGRDASS